MTLRTSIGRHRGEPGDAGDYQLAFTAQVHQLLAWGFTRLRADLSHIDEEKLSGELARRIRQVIEDGQPPEWKWNFVVHNEKPQDSEGIFGKDRLLIDLELELTGRGAHPRFQFEAKRLRRSRTDCVAEYLNEEGLQSYVEGHYAHGHPAAGMLGLIQSDHEDYWLRRLEERLQKVATDTRWDAKEGWTRVELVKGLVSAYRTIHDRDPKHGGRLEVFHTFLDCSLSVVGQAPTLPAAP